MPNGLPDDVVTGTDHTPMAGGDGIPVPKVSVIVIFLNAGKYLQEAIDSVLRQTFADWELLLVDDGSTDDSGEIARAAAARVPQRVRYLCHPGAVNRGMSATRNLGIANARGELIAFLDGDDVWLPARLERHLATLERYSDCAMVCSPCRYWFRWTRRDVPPTEDVPEDPLRQLGMPVGVSISPPAYLIGVLDETAKSPATCSITIRKEVAQRLGGFDEDFVGMFEDQVFFAKVQAHERIVVMGEVLDLYRQHPSSACYEARLKGHYHGTHNNPEQRAFVKRVGEILDGMEAPPPELIRAVDRWHTRFRHPIRTKVMDALRDPRRSARMSLRHLAGALLPRKLYRKVWAKAQGFDATHGEPQ